MRSLDDSELREVVDGFVEAWERSDVDAVVAMLTDEAAITMPPIPTWYRGREAVGGFLRRRPLARADRWRLLPTSANGQLAFGFYLQDGEDCTFIAHHIAVLTMRGRRIAEITAFLDAELLPRFGLPDEIEP